MNNNSVDDPQDLQLNFRPCSVNKSSKELTVNNNNKL